jgi:hypothetical protein
MPEITCSAVKCTFNNEGYCVREYIRIDVDDCDSENCCTCCDSFSEDEHASDNAYLNSIGDDSGVECFATNCIYNENCECVADSINVEGNDADCCTDTFCDTYRPVNH